MPDFDNARRYWPFSRQTVYQNPDFVQNVVMAFGCASIDVHLSSSPTRVQMGLEDFGSRTTVAPRCPIMHHILSRQERRR